MQFCKKITFLFVSIIILIISGCASTTKQEKVISEKADESETITLLFAGDIMAHTQNYQVSDYKKIWADITDIIEPADISFANIEAPIDSTKKASSYPNFNMTYNYVKATIDAGFDTFSLCNNHTNDQGLNGIKETEKTLERLNVYASDRDSPIYYSGLKDGKQAQLSYNLMEKNGWKILFLPITELLNRPDYSEYINFIQPTENSRTEFINFCKNLREENPCDLFVLSVHTSEPEYTRTVTENQNRFYMNLLEAGVDILWANHAHIIKDRNFIFNSEQHSQKIIMYANGNTISGQRREPDFNSPNPTGERDNTGDGLLYTFTFSKKDRTLPPQLISAKPYFITTYINTANEYVIKKLDENFVTYLYDVKRNDWAEYIKKRIKINRNATKDIIVWQ